MLAGTALPHTLRHGLLVHLGIWFLTAFAVSVHVTYRVPSWLIVTWLPWVGLVLLVLGLLMLINHVLTNPTGRTAVLTPAERWSMVSSLALLLATLVAPGGVLGEMLTLLLWVALAAIVVTLLVMATRLAAPALGPLALHVLRRLEQGATMLIGAFDILSVLLFANGFGDFSPVVERSSEVLAIGGGEVEIFGATLFSWADLKSLRRPGTVERVLLTGPERSRTWPGQPIIVQVRPGALGIPWVVRIFRDDEKYYEQVLSMAPTAAGPRRERLLWLVERQRWEDTVRAGQEYVRLYPDDYEFMIGIAASVARVRRAADAVSLLEPFLARQPRNYELLNFVGWALHHSGQSARGIEILASAIPIEPENFMAYYHLGYVYRDTGRPTEAVAMFEKVLERRRNYPEIERQLQLLR